MRLWDLPGPRRFINSACDSLRGGSNIVVRFPGTVPEGFDDALAAALGNALHFGHLSATASPFEQLRTKFATDPSHVHSLSDLCDNSGFRGRLIRLHNLDERNWPAWRDFLGRYVQTSRSRHVLGRSLFLIPLSGLLPATPPLADVGLTHCTWDGVLEDVDLLLFASERLRQRSVDALLHSLLATVVARVSVWDFDTAAALLAESDRTILAPTDFLRTIAQNKGWTANTQLDWRLETASHSGVAHPARAAIEDPPNEIHRRIWSAQLSVLLPWIETRRHETVTGNLYEVRRQMRQAGNGRTDPYELELGELSAMFSQRGANRRIRRTVRRLRDVRNELAHRRHLTPDAVLNLIEAPSMFP